MIPRGGKGARLLSSVHCSGGAFGEPTPQSHCFTDPMMVLAMAEGKICCLGNTSNFSPRWNHFTGAAHMPLNLLDVQVNSDLDVNSEHLFQSQWA